MKKRLSLLMVLMMVVSLLPMSAFAAPSSIKVTDPIDVTDTANATNEPASVGYEFKHVAAVASQLGLQNVRLELTNGAEFATAVTATLTNVDDGTVAGGGPWTISAIGDNMAIWETASATAYTKDVLLTFSFGVNYENASPGDVNLVITDNSQSGAPNDKIGSRTHKLAVVKDSDTSNLAMKVTDADKTMSFDGGKLSQFEISNIPLGTTYLVVEVDKDVTFAGTDTTAYVAGDTRVIGVGGLKADLNTETTGFGSNKLVIDLDTNGTVGTKSSVIVIPEFNGLGRKANIGSVYAITESYSTVSAPVAADRPDKTNRAIIGSIVDFDVTMEVVETGKKVIPDVWGGEEATVKVTLKGPKGTISNRAIDFEVKGADVLYGTVGSFKSSSPTFAGATMPTASEERKTNDSSKPGYVLVKDAEFSIVPTNTSSFDTKTEISFEMTIRTKGDTEGVATITALQRGLEVTTDLAKITPKFTVATEVTPVKKGEARDTATVVIKEAKAGLLARNERLELTFETRRDYTQITSKGIKVETTNGMELDTRSSAITWVVGDDGKDVGLSIPITRSSAGEPAEITITGLNVAVDGSATEDVVQLVTNLTGTRTGDVTVAETDYIKVVKEYDFESILSVFTIGQTTYTVNGIEKAAASAPYIKDGRTMLPIRAVAESLGLTVQWNAATKTATFTDANKVAAVTIGASTLYVNGTPVPLTAPAELVNDTTFVELRSLATAFGVQIDWDAAAKTATVSK